MLDMIRRFPSKNEQIKLFQYANKIKIDFISSAFDLDSLEFLINKLKIKNFKNSIRRNYKLSLFKKDSFDKKKNNFVNRNV